MAKYIDGVELTLQMWSTVSLSSEEIQEIFPAFADMTDLDDTDELEQALQDHMDMNYYEYVSNADGALDECKVHFVIEDDGSE